MKNIKDPAVITELNKYIQKAGLQLKKDKIGIICNHDYFTKMRKYAIKIIRRYTHNLFIQGAFVFERNSHALKRNYNFLWDMRYSQKKELWKKLSNHHKGA